MNSDRYVFGLQGYKGYERLHGLQIFKIRILILYAVER